MTRAAGMQVSDVAGSRPFTVRIREKRSAYQSDVRHGPSFSHVAWAYSLKDLLENTILCANHFGPTPLFIMSCSARA